MQNRDFLHGESGVVKEGNKGALAAVLVAFKVLGWITTEVQPVATGANTVSFTNRGKNGSRQGKSDTGTETKKLKAANDGRQRTDGACLWL